MTRYENIIGLLIVFFLPLVYSACDSNSGAMDNADPVRNIQYKGSYTDGRGENEMGGASIELRDAQGDVLKNGTVSQTGAFVISALSGSGTGKLVFIKSNTTLIEIDVDLATGKNFGEVRGNRGFTNLETTANGNTFIGETFTADVNQYVDNDEAPPYEYQVDNQLFSISTDGAISFQATVVGDFNTTITFTDTRNAELTTTLEFVLTITPTPNFPPTITSQRSDDTGFEETLFTDDYSTTAQDANGDVLIFDVNNPSNATASFIGSVLEVLGDKDVAGAVIIQVFVTDGLSDPVAYDSRTITLENTPDNPVFDVSNPYPAYQTALDTNFSIPIKGFSDPDTPYGDTATYSLVGADHATHVASADSIAITPESGYDGTMPNVRVRRTDQDGLYAESNAFTITVRANNSAPVEQSPTPSQIADEDETIDVLYDVLDSEGDELSYLHDAQVGLNSMPIQGGTRFWMDADSSGTFDVQAYSFDGSLTTALTPFSLTFSPTPDAPRMLVSTYPDQTVLQGRALKQYMPDIWYSPDGKNLSYEVSNLVGPVAVGLVIDFTTGLPTDTLFIQASPFWNGVMENLEWIAKDGRFQSRSNFWSLTVEAVNHPPRLKALPLTVQVYIDQGTSYVLDMSNHVWDPDGDQLIHEVFGLIPEFTYRTNGDLITFTPDSSFVGKAYDHYITTTDGQSDPIIWPTFDINVVATTGN